MAETDRDEAQRRREDARRQRRESQASSSEQTQGDAGVAEDESHPDLKHAAKVAAAGAAVGAAVGAALAARDGHSDEDEENGAEGGEPAAQGDDAVGAGAPAAEEADEQRAEPAAQSESAGEDERETEDRHQPVAEREPEPPREPQDEAPRRGASQDETIEVVRRAREQLQALQGHESESVSSLERTAEGWTVTLEVVELPRVPDSTDVMASYELLLDDEKNVIRFTRGRRYYRSQADRDGRA
jgi:hypothetical protein